MKNLLRLTFWAWVGYTVVLQAAPYVQAKIEAMDLDRMWEIWDEEEA